VVLSQILKSRLVTSRWEYNSRLAFETTRRLGVQFYLPKFLEDRQVSVTLVVRSRESGIVE
jgi:hypothetical protein